MPSELLVSTARGLHAICQLLMTGGYRTAEKLLLPSSFLPTMRMEAASIHYARPTTSADLISSATSVAELSVAHISQRSTASTMSIISHARYVPPFLAPRTAITSTREMFIATIITLHNSLNGVTDAKPLFLSNLLKSTATVRINIGTQNVT